MIDYCMECGSNKIGTTVTHVTLGDGSLSSYLESSGDDQYHITPYRPRLDWVIVGGETGPGARPMHPDWARSLRDQCQAAGVPFFLKHWGEWLSPTQHPLGKVRPTHAVHRLTGETISIAKWVDLSADERDEWAAVARVGRKAAGRLLDGREWNEMPNG